MEELRHILDSKKIHHAYLFCGPKGSRKEKAAILFCKSLLCKNQIENGCGTCSECIRIESENHPSVAVLYPDGATIKIQQIKELQKRFALRGIEGEYQIYIIHHADTMSLEAANSLLKFLEEPTGSTIAILLAEQAERLLPTILSRCQKVRFSHTQERDVIETLLERGVNRSLAELVSRLWNDVDAIIELLESEKFATIQKIMVQLNEDLRTQKHQYVLLLESEWFSKKPTLKDTEYLIDYMLFWFRDLLFRELDFQNRCVFPDSDMSKYRNVFTVDVLEGWISDIIKIKQKLHYNINPQLALEALLLQMQEELMCIG